jgi:hypothetical protein
MGILKKIFVFRNRNVKPAGRQGGILNSGSLPACGGASPELRTNQEIGGDSIKAITFNISGFFVRG